MTPREILIAARALIAEPEHWTQRAAARNRLGMPVGALEPSACCWCAAGALFRVAGRFNDRGYYAGMKALCPVTGPGVVVLNDMSTHADVLAMFDKAIG